MRLRDFLHSGFVVPRLSATSPDGILSELATAAAAAGLGDEATVRSGLAEREAQHTTVLGGGLAVPHATIEGLAAPALGVARADAPVLFGGEETEPVRLFFVLLSPPGHERDHVKLLGRICRLARTDDFFDRLVKAEDGPTLVDAIHSFDERHP